MNRLVWITAAASLVASCSAVKPLYGGNRHTRAEVGVLNMNVNGSITSINKRALDGRHYELLPGLYHFQFRTYQQHKVNDPQVARIRVTATCEFRLLVEAGHTYEIDSKKIQFTHGVPRTGWIEMQVSWTDPYVTDLDSEGTPVGKLATECQVN